MTKNQIHTMTHEQTYTYYAFVSYSHKDEKWAKWIQAALERYCLPATVRKKVGKPLSQRIHPVFRDDTDLEESIPEHEGCALLFTLLSDTALKG